MSDVALRLKIGVSADDPSLVDKARKLSEDLKLPFVSSDEQNLYRFLLCFTPEHLELRDSQLKRSPLFVDFTHGSLDYRRRFSQGQHLILKAIGGANQTVLDGMAG